MKKIGILLVLSLLSLALFTACTSNADTMPSPSPMVSASPIASPTVTVSVMPVSTAAPSVEAGVNTLEDAKRVSDNVAQEVEKLSELTMADAIVAGNIAIIGVRYDSQYQGGLTDRLTEMVTTRVHTIDKSLTAVHVSADQKVLDKI
ncbi:MAG: YhcN/YlaJ family sporulation lipoprotein, partial [Clostridia bacterium]